MPTFTTAFEPPPTIEGLTASAETAAAVILEWSPTTLAEVDFVAYQVYRSTTGQADDYELLATISDRAQATYIDYEAPIDVPLYYRLTQLSHDGESEPAETTSRLDVCEFWLVTVGAVGESFELPNVTDYASSWPLQSTEHEPLGRPYKLIETGQQLGEEGSLTCVLLPEDAPVLARLRSAVAGIDAELLLKTPYGEVFEVDLGTIERERQQGGRQRVTFRFVQVA